ncbi:MAG: hypothetical protein B7Z55_14595, partial [Planctomycetales bacterium 12-60-4]
EFSQYFAGDGDPDPTRHDRGIPHLLRLMNSPQFSGNSVSSLATAAARSGRPADQVIDELFVRILSRRSTASEQEMALEHLRGVSSQDTAYRDLAWVLLVSNEFSLNH